MAVIINEFEIVVETPKQAEVEQATQASLANQPQRLSPRDLQDLLRYCQQREQRVAAH